jgi:hypothetical protein
MALLCQSQNRHHHDEDAREASTAPAASFKYISLFASKEPHAGNSAYRKMIRKDVVSAQPKAQKSDSQNHMSAGLAS